MKNMQLIDLKTWERRECFEHFMSVAKSTYSITVNVDITKLLGSCRMQNFRLYPTFTWIVTKAVNNQKEFKMGYDEQQRLGYFDVIYPDYAVMNEKTKIMDSLCTPYREDFATFYEQMVTDLEAYKENGLKTPQYENCFVASCLPWITYSSFTASNESGYSFLFPMVTWGKYFEAADQVLMPVTIQIHHAVADGYHCARFFKDIQEIGQSI